MTATGYGSSGLLASSIDSTGTGVPLGASFATTFNISFSSPVEITAYLVGSVTETDTTLDLTGGTPDTTGLNFGATGTQPISPLISLPASPSSLTVTANFQSGKTGTNYLQGLDATEVPWETDVLPLVGATILFGGGMWWKRRRGASQIDVADQGQEPGQE